MHQVWEIEPEHRQAVFTNKTSARVKPFGFFACLAPVAQQVIEPAEFLLVNPPRGTWLDVKNKPFGTGQTLSNPLSRLLKVTESRLCGQAVASDVVFRKQSAIFIGLSGIITVSGTSFPNDRRRTQD
jgi:hypothetical protein